MVQLEKRNERHLTMEQLVGADRRRRDRHRRRRLHRHAGPAAGQAAARPLLPRRRARARHRGLQLPARRRRRHEHRRRLRDVLVGARLRRHGVRPRPATRSGCSPHLPGHRDGPVRPGLARPLPGRCSRRARSCQRQLDRCAEHGWHGAGRHRARVHRLQQHLRGGRGRGATATSPRPTSTTSTTRSSAPAASSRCCATIRNDMYAAGLDVESAKGECNLGQHEIGFLYDEALTTADNHSVYKTVAKEIAAQQGKALTFMAKYNEREGNSCHIHLLAARRGRRRSSSGTRARRAAARRSTTTSSPACSRRCADFTLLYAPEHQLLQAVRGRLVRADRDRLGPRQPHLRAAAGRPRRGRADGEPGARRRRQPLPRARPRCSPAACTASSNELRARARAGRQRLRLRQAARAAHAARRRATRSPPPRSPARPSATRSSTTTSTWPTSSWRPSTRPSPTGSCRRGFERL